ncbi:MAG: hypothetical protein R3F59_03045 [Myxococcota bacterium]
MFTLLACGDVRDGRDTPVPPGGVIGAARLADREVTAERIGHGPLTRLVAREGAATRVLLAEGSPDRPALSPDGRWVAFVYAPEGLAAVGLVPFAGGAPQQLTNAGLARAKHAVGEPPAGFVPVPTAAPAFADGQLTWTDATGQPHAVALPAEAR